MSREQILIRALERIAAGDPQHSQFAALAISEARTALETLKPAPRTRPVEPLPNTCGCGCGPFVGCTFTSR